MDWGLVELAVGGKNHRGVYQDFMRAWKPLARNTESYATYQILPADAKGKEKSWDGPVWAPFLPIDIDRATVEEALHDLRRLLRLWLMCGYAPETARVYFSGKKGFHVHIPEQLFGGLPRRWDLSAVLSTIADELCGDVVHDTTIYQVNRLWRLPASRHADTGLYKVLLHEDEVWRFSVEDVKALATAPNEARVPKVHMAAIEPWDCAVSIRKHAEEKPLPARRPVYAGNGAEANDFLCYGAIERNGVDEGLREQAARWWLSHMRRAYPTFSASSIEAVAVAWNVRNRPPLPEKELLGIVEKAHADPLQHSCTLEVTTAFCDPKCVRYQQAMEKRGLAKAKDKIDEGPPKVAGKDVGAADGGEGDGNANVPGGSRNSQKKPKREPAREIIKNWALSSGQYLCRAGSNLITNDGVLVNQSKFRTRFNDEVTRLLYSNAVETTPTAKKNEKGEPFRNIPKVFWDYAGSVFDEVLMTLPNIRDLPIEKIPKDIVDELVDDLRNGLTGYRQLSNRTHQRLMVSSIYMEIKLHVGTEWTAATNDYVWARKVDSNVNGIEIALQKGFSSYLRGELSKAAFGDNRFMARLVRIGIAKERVIRARNRTVRVAVLTDDFVAEHLGDIEETSD